MPRNLIHAHNIRSGDLGYIYIYIYIYIFYVTLNEIAMFDVKTALEISVRVPVDSCAY